MVLKTGKHYGSGDLCCRIDEYTNLAGHHKAMATQTKEIERLQHEAMMEEIELEQLLCEVELFSADDE